MYVYLTGIATENGEQCLLTVVDITERKQTEEARRENESLLHTLVQTIPELIWLKDKEGVFLSCNVMFERFIGARKAEIIGKTDYDFIDRDLADYFRDNDHKAMAAGKPTTNEEWNTFADDGHRALLETIKTPMYDSGGKLIGVLGIAHDITDRRQEEIALQLSEKKYRFIVENVGEGIGFVNAEEEFVVANSSAEKIFGVGKGELLGKNLKEFLSEEQYMRILAQTKIRKDGQNSNYEFELTRLNGKKRNVIITAVPQLDDNKKFIGTHGIFRDVTEQKQAVQILEESESSLRYALELAKMGSWELDLVTQKTRWSDNYFAILGFKPEEVEPNFELFRSRIHPDDIHLLDETNAAIMKDKTPASFELRLIQPDDTFIWIQNNISPVIEDDKLVKLKGVIIDITERKRAEKALLESDAQYKVLSNQLEAILDHLPGLVFYKDLKNNFIRVNKYLAQAHGKEKEELEGKNLSELYPEEDATNYYQDDLAVIDSGIAKLNIEELWETAKGLKWVSTSKIPFVGDNGEFIGIIGMSIDIIERKRVEEELAQERYLMGTLMDNLPDHIYFKDMESRFVRINKAHASLFGLDNPDLAIGKSDFDFFSGEHSQQAYEDEQAIIRTGQPLSIEEKETYQDRPDTWVSTVKMPLLDKEGIIMGTFGISRDITKRQSAKEEIRLKNEELQKLNTEKDKLFSIIAHDLRGPLSSFMGLTEIMATDSQDFTPDQKKDLTLTMSNSARNIFNLLENLLEWSQMQRGNTAFNPQILGLMDVVNESAKIVVESARGKAIEIVVDITGEQKVFADINMLQFVIRNLVSNAIKFTPKGGRITISAGPGENHMIVIAVKDTGIGMGSEMIDNLFRIDIKSSRSGTEGERGIGLGLLLCKEFVEKNGGRIWVESEVNKGSTFCFTLPADQLQVS